MELTRFDGYALYRTLIAGAKRLIGERMALNKINVFPVADGDTGSNLSFQMQTIIDESKPGDTVSATMESIASAAMSGSRGNSGIIFTEYLNGLYETLKGKVVATLDDFAAAVKSGVKKAYLALAKPVEGTILTVLRKAFLVEAKHATINEYIAKSYERAKVALIETTSELEVLRINGVVDAGAQGFTVFLEGMHHYLSTGESEIIVAPDSGSFIAVTHGESIEERYCTEAILIDADGEPAAIRAAFAADGSSVIVAGRRDRMRIHIHTDRPDLVFQKLAQHGRIAEQKVDDMVRQLEALAPDRPAVAIVTDSIADLPAAMMDDLQIHMLPIGLLADGTAYLDKVTISAATFYDLMKTAKETSSSQPSTKQIARLLDFLGEHYRDILVFTVSGAMSGTSAAVRQYAENNANVTVFDTLLNSGAQGLVVRKAAELARNGVSAAEILRDITAFRDRTKIYVGVATLKYMVKQGRISKMTGLAAKILNMKPVVSIDEQGKGSILHKAFSRRGAFRYILDLVAAKPVENYAVVHAGAPDLARKIAADCRKATGKEPLYIDSISPIVAMNAGIGAVAVAVTYAEGGN